MSGRFFRGDCPRLGGTESPFRLRAGHSGALEGRPQLPPSPQLGPYFGLIWVMQKSA